MRRDGRHLRDAAMLDRVIEEFDAALRAVTGVASAGRPMPQGAQAPRELTPAERRESGALMRVNHVGEVCAQALYRAQALTAKDPALRERYRAAAREEADHLAWTAQRLDQLGARPSLLDPLWFAGAYAIGALAGRAGDRISLGFMAETERQVEAHLDGHLGRIAGHDLASRAVIERMRADEAEHAQAAVDAGGAELPAPVRAAMRLAARVMTATAERF